MGKLPSPLIWILAAITGVLIFEWSPQQAAIFGMLMYLFQVYIDRPRGKT